MENNTIDNSHKINLDDVEIGMKTTDKSDEFEAQEKLSHREIIELDGRKGFFKMRKTWSCWIIGWITCIILFHIVLVCLIGCEKLQYKDNGWVLVTAIVEGLLEIVGMGIFVVKFLFDDRSCDKSGGK